MTLPRMSRDGTPGYPAPETACSVVTMTERSPKTRSGASTIAITTVEQLGFVTIAPDHPRSRRCRGMSAR